MKRLGFPIMALVLLAAAAGCTPPATTTATLAPTEAVNPWDMVLSLEIEHPARTVGFLDESFGVTVGPRGDVRYTTDGGATWFEGDGSTLNRFGLDIVDDQVAWHCGDGGIVRLSTDGGRTWQAVGRFGLSAPKHCRFLRFLDARTGWAATQQQLGATVDGGATWTEVSLPEGMQEILAIDLYSPTEGYLLDAGGNLFITRDGGDTWTTRALDLVLEEGLQLMPGGAPTAAMRFTDPYRGLVVVSAMGGGKTQMLALRTTDGGQSWAQKEIPLPEGWTAPTLYLAHDGVTLTSIFLMGEVAVWQYGE